jgi:hypothetical protein
LQEKDSKGFKYFRLIAKLAGLVLVLVSVLIYMVHYVSNFAERIGLVIFVIGALLWILDTILSVIYDWSAIKK